MIAVPPEIANLGASLTAPFYALPLDLFRILAGLVSFFYFGSALREATDFTSPDGLIDHRLSQRLLPPTRLSLFQPGISAGVLRAALALACLASLFVVAGYQVRSTAAFLFLVAVSTYRWNMLVTYVDDAIMHLVLFWLILLPVGRTLTLHEWLRNGSTVFETWVDVTVPGGATRLFMVNLAIAYFTAGVYKWTSPMWRNGTALYAILKLPIALTPDFWNSRHMPLVRVGSYGALAAEPFFPLMFVLPASSIPKTLVVASVVVFHLGIVVTLKIPFANLAMLGAIPVVLHDEIMRGLLGRPALPGAGAGFGLPEYAGVVLLGCISLMLLLEVRFVGRFTSPGLWKTSVSGFRRNPMCIVLWCFGIAQSYRLFDWIDLRNYHARYEVVEHMPDGSSRAVDPGAIFPRTIRHLLLQSYLHGSIWHQIDPAGLREVRRSILERYARRYARRHGDGDSVEVFAIRQRITSDNLRLERGVRRPLLRCSFDGGEPVIEYLCLEPERGYFHVETVHGRDFQPAAGRPAAPR